MNKILGILKTGIQCSRGLYSKRQCTKLATNIGKELVDSTRAGQQLSKEIVQETIKKHAPKLNIDIIDNIDDLQRLGKFSEFEAESIASQGLNFYYGASEKGFIYLADGCAESNIPIIAHECEHALNGENTFLMKFIKRLPESKKTKSKNMESSNNFEMLLKEYLNLDSLADSNYKTLREYLQSDNFIGLTSEQRIDAYIRAISRYCANPKNGKNASKLFAEILGFKDEMRAHSVSKAVAEYQGVENTGMFTICKELYERTYSILKRDFLIALKNVFKNKDVKTSLPSNACKIQTERTNYFKNMILKNQGADGSFPTVRFTEADLYPELYQ